MALAVCPKCGHRPPQPLGATDACPACGVYMHKWSPPETAAAAAVPNHADACESSWRERFLTLPDQAAGDLVFIAPRALLLIVLALWGAYLATRDIADGAAWPHFMHGILLVIHEAGHVLFRPFGEFLMMAGGSLFQVLLPLGVGVAFLLKNRDPFGAAVCLWWTGISLVDLAPYIYDALDPQLMLLGGRTGEDGPHDWIYLFDRMGGLQHAHFWGQFCRLFGAVLAGVALLWATLVLRRMWSRRP